MRERQEKIPKWGACPVREFFVICRSRLGITRSFWLVSDKWHQSHETCSFSCTGEVSLLLSSETSTTTAVHTSVRIHVVVQLSYVFVVNVLSCASCVFCFHSFKLAGKNFTIFLSVYFLDVVVLSAGRCTQET